MEDIGRFVELKTGDRIGFSTRDQLMVDLTGIGQERIQKGTLKDVFVGLDHVLDEDLEGLVGREAVYEIIGQEGRVKWGGYRRRLGLDLGLLSSQESMKSVTVCWHATL